MRADTPYPAGPFQFHRPCRVKFTAGNAQSLTIASRGVIFNRSSIPELQSSPDRNSPDDRRNAPDDEDPRRPDGAGGRQRPALLLPGPPGDGPDPFQQEMGRVGPDGLRRRRPGPEGPPPVLVRPYGLPREGALRRAAGRLRPHLRGALPLVRVCRSPVPHPAAAPPEPPLHAEGGRRVPADGAGDRRRPARRDGRSVAGWKWSATSPTRCRCR